MIAARIYRLLLRLFPAPLHSEYGELMEQAFADQLRDARTSGQRTTLYAATLLDLIRSLPLSHWKYNARSLHLYALFAAMCAALGWGVAGNLSNRQLHLLFGACTFTMGYLDPGRERTYRFRGWHRWSLRLFLVTGAAGLLWGNWMTHYPGLLGSVFVPAYVGAWLRTRSLPDSTDYYDWPAVEVLDLGLRDPQTGRPAHQQ